MSDPRDFRDPMDVDDCLDAIRACPDREKVRVFYLACLATAYQQGRVDRARETVEEYTERHNGKRPDA